MFKQDRIAVSTRGRGIYNLTAEVERCVKGSDVETGLIHIFCQHTSASLLITENADPDVHRDLETFMSDAVTDGDPKFLHQCEGPDDMPAHIRSILTGSDMTIPIVQGRAGLGIWQGVYLWEHRTAAHQRSVIVTINGN